MSTRATIIMTNEPMMMANQRMRNMTIATPIPALLVAPITA